ncbi:MAG: hypothetical protein M0P31_01455 [Solirubrobacteraceae bacterium]|nr:hypothetical protein [Solirubrobacteraceae bacterium]
MASPTSRLAVLAPLVVAGALALPVAASAAGPSTVDDAVGDRAPDLPGVSPTGPAGDIRRARVTGTKDRWIRFDVDTTAETPASWLFIHLKSGKARYQVRGSSVYAVKSFDVEDGRARRVGPAKVTRVSRTRTRIELSPASLGGPSTLRWRVDALRELRLLDSVPDVDADDAEDAFARFRIPGGRMRVTGPRRVRAGRSVRLRATGFPARTRLAVQLQPSAHRDGNAFGIAIRPRFRTDAKGRRTIRFTMPRRHYRCSPGGDCRRVAWRRRARVDVNVCTFPSAARSHCVRRVVRLR